MSDAGVALGLLARTRGDLQEWKEHAWETERVRDNWMKYAYEMEEMVIELGARLEAALTLIDGLIKAANGDENLRPLLAPDAAARNALLAKARQQSLEGMEQAHRDRIKVNPKATTKEYAIDEKYNPNRTKQVPFGSNLFRLWEDIRESRAARNGKPPTQSQLDEMHDLVIAVTSRLAATSVLAESLIKENKEGKSGDPGSLLTDENARAGVMEKAAANSMKAMCQISTDRLMTLIDPSNPSSDVNTLAKAIAPVAPSPRVNRKMH